MRLLILQFFVLSLFSCKYDSIKKDISVKGNKVLIANEGNFGWGEGTLSIYHPDDLTIDNNAYEAIAFTAAL